MTWIRMRLPPSLTGKSALGGQVTLACAVWGDPSKALDFVVNESCCPCSYRRWKLGDDIDLIVRCEHDGVMTGANGEVSFINIKTLNEWDSRVRHCRSCVPAVCSGVGWSKLAYSCWVQFQSVLTEEQSS